MNAMAQKEQEEPDPEENGMNGEEHSEVKRTPWKLAIGFQSENSPRVLDIEVSCRKFPTETRGV